MKMVTDLLKQEEDDHGNWLQILLWMILMLKNAVEEELRTKRTMQGLHEWVMQVRAVMLYQLQSQQW